MMNAGLVAFCSIGTLIHSVIGGGSPTISSSLQCRERSKKLVKVYSRIRNEVERVKRVMETMKWSKQRRQLGSVHVLVLVLEPTHLA